MDSDDVVVISTLSGLGDCLINSTLPERYTRERNKKVYLHDQNIYSNPEIEALVWGCNKYILGKSNRTPNAGHAKQGAFYEMANRIPIGSIAAMELAHGFGPPYNIAPKIYYEPKPYSIDLSNALLIDFSSISTPLGHSGIQEFLHKMSTRFATLRPYVVTFQNDLNNTTFGFDHMSLLGVQSIFDYVDMIGSCRAWIGSESGGQVLASAVRGAATTPEIVSLMSPATYNSRGYTFQNVDYRITKDAPGPDYWNPIEIAYERFIEGGRQSAAASQAAYAERQKQREEAHA